MNSDKTEQWQRREGYDGPESFPEDELAEYSVGTTNNLAGKEFEIHLSDGQVFRYWFLSTDTLEFSSRSATNRFGKRKQAKYRASEADQQVYFVKHNHLRDSRTTTCLVLDLNRAQAVRIHGQIPKPGDAQYRVQLQHVGGVIGAPQTPGEVQAPPFPTDLIGKQFVAEYSGRYAWELLYLNRTKVAWHGLKGNPGIGDVEEYNANQFSPGVYVVSWSEESETLAAVFLYNMKTGTITGHMWGYAPEINKLIHAPLGGRIVDSRDFGISARRVADADGHERLALQKNKDVVLRAHYEVWNRANYDLIQELYSPDFQAHFICGIEISGQQGMREFIEGHHRSFPDWTERVVDIVAEGDRVVTRYLSTGTHKGEFNGLPASGRPTEIAEVSIHRVLNGKIVEQWGFPDGLHHVQQLTD